MSSTGSTSQEGRLVADDATARELACRFGTPLFVYSADVIREEYGRLHNALTYRPVSVYYSV